MQPSERRYRTQEADVIIRMYYAAFRMHDVVLWKWAAVLTSNRPTLIGKDKVANVLPVGRETKMPNFNL